MFERVELARERCVFCGTYGQVAGLPTTPGDMQGPVDACEKCLRATGKVADLLALLRKAKAPPPKKTRKGAQSSATAPPPVDRLNASTLHVADERAKHVASRRRATAAKRTNSPCIGHRSPDRSDLPTTLGLLRSDLRDSVSSESSA